jgi:predicted phosphodiesterase
MNSMNSVTIGIISDTHGLLRPEVVNALAGCDHILHAGDVGDNQVLERLARIAPVTAVRGNMDCGSWSNVLAVTEMVDFDTVFFLYPPRPAPSGFGSGGSRDSRGGKRPHPSA